MIVVAVVAVRMAIQIGWIVTHDQQSLDINQYSAKVGVGFLPTAPQTQNGMVPGAGSRRPV